MAKGLTDRQQTFVATYLANGFDGKAAALAAGYSPKSAECQASQLLKNPKVSEEISKKQGKRLGKLEITADRVLNELAKMAFVDPRKFFNEDGTPKHITELDEDTAASLAGIEIEDLFNYFGDGQAKVIGKVKKYKLSDRLRALEALGRVFKMFTDKVEVSGLDGLADAIQKARQRAKK